MAEHALHIVCLTALLYSTRSVEASSSTYHRIQVGGPANQITTGEIRIDLPSQSFQNIKFNITPYSLQNEYSPYYDQYSTGYQPSPYSPPKTKTYKPLPPNPTPQPAYKPPQKLSYQPAPLVSYKPSSSIPQPVYSYPQASYNQPTYTQPKVPYNQPAYIQPHVSYKRPSYSPIEVQGPSHHPKTAEYGYTPVKAEAPITKPEKTKPAKEPSEGNYSAYPYPYQQNSYRKLETKEETTLATPAEDVEEDTRSGKTVVIEDESAASDDSEDIFTEVFKKFKSFNLEFESSPDSEKEDTREPKNLDPDAEDFNINSVDLVASTTLLPQFVPIVFKDTGVSTIENNIFTTETSVELITTIQTLPTTLLTSTPATTTSSPATTTSSPATTTSPVTTTSSPETATSPVTTASSPATTTSSATTTLRSKTTTPSSIRRRPVISFFHDLPTPTQAPSTVNVTPPGDIGQNILDKMRTATLTVEALLDSDEEITIKPNEDKNNDDIISDKETNVNKLETEINNTGDEKQSRERRKIVKVRKSKTNPLNQGSNYSSHWQDGRWF